MERGRERERERLRERETMKKKEKEMEMEMEPKRGTEKVEEMKAKVAQVQGVMRENIEMVMDRGEKIDILVDKAQDLQKEAGYYRDNGRAIKRKMWCKNMKIKLIVITVLILILVLIIWSSICGGFNCSN